VKARFDGSEFRSDGGLRVLREVWPRVKIVFRADSGFCRDLILTYFDPNDIWRLSQNLSCRR